jgi:hypothetical protein
MSILWFMFIMFCYGSRAKVTDLNLLMVPVFYIGDCILLTNRR